MARYPLAALLVLREQRLNKATQTVATRKEQVRLAKSQLKQAQTQLEEYLSWRSEEIERRYQALLGTVQSQQELADFNAGLGALYAQEESLNQALTQAQVNWEQAREALKAAEAALHAAHKAHEKLLRHQELWQVKERALAEYRADQELEDFKGKAPVDYERAAGADAALGYDET